jgi:colicin import membrane protein
MENQIVKLPEELAQIATGVSAEKRHEVQTVLNQVFQGVSKMRSQLDQVVVSDESDKTNMKLANTIRLGVRQVRLDAEKTFDAKRSEVQQAMLSFKTEDSLWLKAKQTMQILTKEIEENAKWKEETKARFDAEQKELKVQERILQLSKFSTSVSRSDFENMSDEFFSLFLSGIEKQYNDRIEAEKQAEIERIETEKAEIAERERIKFENEKLKAEAEAKAKEIEALRQKTELEKIAIEQEARKAKEEAEKILQAERVAARLAKEKADKEKAELEAKIQAQKQAEAKAKKDIEAAIAKAKKEAEKLAKAPIKRQLDLWVDSFSINLPNSELLNNDKALLIKEKFEAFKKWAKNEIETI